MHCLGFFKKYKVIEISGPSWVVLPLPFRERKIEVNDNVQINIIIELMSALFVLRCSFFFFAFRFLLLMSPDVCFFWFSRIIHCLLTYVIFILKPNLNEKRTNRNIDGAVIIVLEPIHVQKRTNKEIKKQFNNFDITFFWRRESAGERRERKNHNVLLFLPHKLVWFRPPLK